MLCAQSRCCERPLALADTKLCVYVPPDVTALAAAETNVCDVVLAEVPTHTLIVVSVTATILAAPLYTGSAPPAAFAAALGYVWLVALLSLLHVKVIEFAAILTESPDVWMQLAAALTKV